MLNSLFSPVNANFPSDCTLAANDFRLPQPTTGKISLILISITWPMWSVHPESSNLSPGPIIRFRHHALELAEGVNFRGRGMRLGRWEGGWRIRLGKFSCQDLLALVYLQACPGVWLVFWITKVTWLMTKFNTCLRLTQQHKFIH